MLVQPFDQIMSTKLVKSGSFLFFLKKEEE